MRGGRSKSYGLLALFLMAGAILGGILGEFIADWAVLAEVAPYLVKTYQIIDVPPVVMNLFVVKLIIGFSLQANFMGVLGILAAIFLFRRF